MAHRGIMQYSGDEGSNIALGQLGFKELIPSSGTSGSGNIGTSGDKTGDTLFVAIKVVGQASVDFLSDDFITITAESLHGDDLTACIFTAGSLVYGPFKKITMSSPTDGDVHVLCYYG